MLVDNTTCLQLVFKECLSTGKLVAQLYKYCLVVEGDGKGRFSDKVIKIPSRRGPDALRFILNDFEANGNGLSFLIIMTLKAKSIFMNS
jgi:sulfite reductase (ferredoxin)